VDGKYYDRYSGSGIGVIEGVELAQEKDRWRTLVKAVMKIRVP